MKERTKVARAFDIVRERILARGVPITGASQARVILLMSRAPREGVTTLAVGLARAFRRTGDLKVLIIETGIGRVSAAYLLGVGHDKGAIPAPDRPGSKIINRITHVRTQEIDLLHLQAQKPRIGSRHPAWDECIAEIKTKYDVIIFDAGSLQSQVPLHWCWWVEQSLLVVDTTKTSMGALRRMKDEFENKHEQYHFDGVILNKRKYYIPGFLYRFL